MLMSLRNKAPILALGGMVALSASALVGAGIGRYAVSGLNPAYTDTYRPLASYTAASRSSGEAFWAEQGQPALRRAVAYQPDGSAGGGRQTPL
jgi:hypothetical protein